MESLYETDVFAENASTKSTFDLKNDTVDPYSQAHNNTFPSGAKETMRFRDRLTIMELRATDQQVERYAQHISNDSGSEEEFLMPVKGLLQNQKDAQQESKGSSASPANVMDELFAIDMEMDNRGCAKDAKCEIAAIMELYKMDTQADRSRSLAGVGMYRELYAIDALVDKSSTNVKEVEFVDPMTVHWMKQCQLASVARSKAVFDGAGEMSELYRMDLDVDGLRSSNYEMDGVAALLETDLEIDRAAKKSERKDDVGDLQELYALDVKVDAAFKSLLKTDQELDGRAEDLQVVDHIVSKETEEGKELIGNLFDVADLLFTDLEVDQATEKAVNKSEKTRRRRSFGNKTGNETVRKTSRGTSVDGTERLTQVENKPTQQGNIAMGQSKDGEEFIEHFFGLPPTSKLSTAPNVETKNTEPEPDDAGDELIGHIFGLKNVPGLLNSTNDDRDESKLVTEKHEKEGRVNKITSYFKLKGKQFFSK